MDDFFVGAVVSVYGRQLKITDYGDVATRKRFEVDRQRTFGMAKTDAPQHRQGHRRRLR